MKTILAPLDFSEVTTKVIEATADLARDLEAKVLLLHVVPPPVLLTAYGISQKDTPDFLIREEKQAREKLDTHQKRLEQEGIQATAISVQGPPIESILLLAQENAADILIMGSHGHGAFYEFIVGSTTRGVLKGFPGPVMIVPARTLHEIEEEEAR